MAVPVLHHTDHLKVLVAHRPGFVQPALLARMAATLDHLTGGGRIAIHFITGGDEADQRREGDFVPHDARYRRTGEVMSIVRRIWDGGHAIRLRRGVLPLRGCLQLGQAGDPGGIPLYFAGASPRGHRGRSGAGRRLRLLGRAPRRRGRADGAHRRGGGQGRPHSFATASRSARSSPTPRARRGRRRSGSPRRPPNGSSWPSSAWPDTRTPTRVSGGKSNATLSVDRDTADTTSVGRKRLIEMSAEREVYDERLWMKVANLTGAAGNSTALVGTPEQVAEAMLRYYDLGYHHAAAQGIRSRARRHRVRQGAPSPGARRRRAPLRISPAHRLIAGRPGCRSEALPWRGTSPRSDAEEEVAELAGDEEDVERWDGGQVDGQGR